MKQRKNILAGTLLLAILTGLLGGCGNETTESGTSEAMGSSVQSQQAQEEGAQGAAEQSEAAEMIKTEESSEVDSVSEPEAGGAAVTLPLTEEPAMLTYWTTVSPMYADAITSLDDCLLWNQMMEDTGVRVEGILVNAQSGAEQFALMVASGEYYDLLDSPGANYTTGLAGALDDDVLVDLTDIVDTLMPNYKAIIGSNEEYSKGTRIDDGRIGMIYGLNNVDYKPTEGPVIRQDWLDALGLDTPKTYDQLHDVLEAFRDQYGASMWIPYSGSPLGNYLGAGYGIATTYLTHMSGREPFFQVDGTVKFGPMEDSYYDYLTMLHQWYEEGLIWNDFVSYTERFNQPPDGGITSGQFGVWFSSYQNFPVWTASAEDPNFHIVAFSDSVQQEGDENHLRAENFLVTNGGVGISTSCQNVELAAKLIDYWFSDEGRYFLTFGIEGTTYELDENGYPQYTDLILNNPDGLSQAAAKALYLGDFGFHTVDHDDYIYLDTGLTDDQTEAPDIWTATSDNSYGIPNVVSMTVEESTENASLLSDIGTYVSTWTLQAITGDQKLTEEPFAEFRATLENQLHIDQCIANKQAALDRYNLR